MTDRPWIVARSKPGQEAWAQENVKRQGRVPYVAHYLDKKSGMKKPIWPGYIFVFSPDGSWRFLTGTYGIATVLMFGSEPARVAAEVVNQLKDNERGGVIDLPDAPIEKYRYNQRLRVVGEANPFIGVFGLYRGMSNESRIRILFDLMGRSVETTLNEADVESA